MYIDWNGREQEDPEMDAMREDARREALRCEWCETWVATHTTPNGYEACDKPRCQDNLEALPAKKAPRQPVAGQIASGERWVVAGRIVSGKLALVRRIVLEAQRQKFARIVEIDSKGTDHEL